MNRIRVLLADDHTLVRAGLRSLLEQMPAVEVVGEASDGFEACRLARSLHPDIVLMDISMPNLNGVEATEQVRKSADVQVLILSMYSAEEYVQRALKAGATGYILKSSATTELELAINAAVAGKTFLSPAVAKAVVGDYLDRTSAAMDSELGALTPRHRHILQLIVEGKTNKQVAQVLHLSIKTVEAHRAELMHRLDIHDVPGLVRYALRTGIISSEEP
ncbi:MAG: response regulator transcription factor [Nitrococcus sp.]|nr:response regulator transcription factor [Nitrococcus sp.]